MINQDEVFVITEDDILKPTDKGKGRGSSQRNTPIALAKPAKANGRESGLDATVDEKPARRARVAGVGNAAAAGTLSLLGWGLGQFYNGDRRTGTFFLMCELQVVAFHYLLYMTWDRILSFSHTFFISEWEMMLYASSVDFCLIFFMIYNVVHAYRGAEAHSGRFTGLHQPFVSGLASLLIPGWGQILNGQIKKAVFFLFAFLMQAYVLALYLASPFYRIVAGMDTRQMLLGKATQLGMGVLFLTALSWILSTYDAVLVARYTRKLNA
jgi:TM2 domain-containing membrane protein YozV